MIMSPSLRRACLTGLASWLMALSAFLFVPGASQAQSEPAGVIRGQVSNQVTSARLAGVIVRIVELSRDTLTEKDGTYEFANVPPGTYTMTYEYTGLDTKDFRVTVSPTAGARQDVDMTSGIYVLPEFTVAGEREGNAAAITQQKNAPNIINSVTADAFGDPAKGNIGNFLRRIPGVTGTSDEIDTQNIQIRGMAAGFTQLDIDGSRYAAGGGGRGQDASGIPTDMIERAEVIKAPTPDTEADSLGGRVNLVTKSAFDRKGREIRVRAANSYSFTYGKDVGHGRDNWLAPEVSLSYADVFSVFGGSNNLGIIAQANYNRVLDVRGTTSWDGSPATVAGTEPGRQQFYQFDNVSVALHGIDRYGASVRGDYKVSPRLTVGSGLSFNAYDNTLLRSRNRMQGGTIRQPLSADFVTVVNGAQYGIERGRRDQLRNRVAARFFTKYNNRGSGIKFDTDFSAQRTTGRNYAEQLQLRSNQRIDYVLDRRHGMGDRRWPTLYVFRERYTGGASNTTVFPSTFSQGYNPFGDDFSNMQASGSNGQWQRIFEKNEIVTAKGNVSKRFDWRFPVEFKTGLAMRNESLKLSRDDLRGTFNTAYGTDWRAIIDPSFDLGGAIGRYPVGTMADVQKVTDLFGISYKGPANDPVDRWNFNPATFAINTTGTRQNTLSNSRQIWERIYGTYLQSNVDLGKLNILAGIRFESTDVTRQQPVRDDSPAVDGTMAEFPGIRYGTASYENYYPSIHAKYDVSRNLIARASWGKTAGRPNWGNILGATAYDIVDHEITVPNLELTPRLSENIDISLEYYFEPVGVFSVGVFEKKITDYDVDDDVPITEAEAVAKHGVPLTGVGGWDGLGGWIETTKRNAGTGRVRGIEFNYSQQLSNVLPGAFRGFGVFANFTYLQTEGTFTLTSGTAKVKQLEDFIPRTANAGLTYDWRRLNLRGTWNFTDHFPEDTNTNPNSIKYRGARWTLDFQGRFKVTRAISVFANFTNVTSNHALKYRGFITEARRTETNALGFLATAGVEARF
jgi:iron complex outermembrane recepter protein